MFYVGLGIGVTRTLFRGGYATEKTDEIVHRKKNVFGNWLFYT